MPLLFISQGRTFVACCVIFLSCSQFFFAAADVFSLPQKYVIEHRLSRPVPVLPLLKWKL